MKAFNYTKYLTESVSNYNGTHKELVGSVPEIYDTITSLLTDVNLDYRLRKDAYVVLGYLFHPSDIFPEKEHGPYGFIEDIMLIMFVLNKVRTAHGADFLQNHFKKDIEKLNSLFNAFEVAKNDLKDLYLDALKITGFIDETL